MRNIFKVLLLLTVSAGAFLSCTKKENKIFFEGGTSPVLTSSVTGTIPLSFANRDNLGLKLTWTNPDYKFTTGLSSQDVAYQIEFDVAGGNFLSPKKVTMGIGKELSTSFTQSQLNDLLFSQMKLTGGIPGNIEVRVKSYLPNNNGELISNVLKFTVTPFVIPPKVNPPSTGKLFITGGATPASWQCGCGEAELASQKFTQVSPTLYVLPSIALTGGQSYLFLPQYGSWSAKYGYIGSNNANNVNGDEFKDNGGDMLSPPATGNYRIEVDFQSGRFTVTKI